jgi:hypothetical protein
MMVYEMLTEAKLRTLKPEDKLVKITDRDGLYIAVAPSGLITFRYNYRINGRQETLTLGRYGYPINRITGEYENPKFNSQLIVEVK